MKWRLLRPVHVSWLIMACAVGIVGGVVVAGFGQWYVAWFSWLPVSLILIGLGLWRRRTYVISFFLIAGCIIGLVRGSAEQSQLAVYKNLYGLTVNLQGTVGDDPDIGKNQELQLRLKNVVVEGREVSGTVWATVSTNNTIKRGDRVELTGRLQDGFGTYAATMWRGDIISLQRPSPGDVGRRVRDWFSQSIRLAIDEPAASLGAGYLVGERRSLPPELDEALRIAGLTHIVVASGYNLTILVRLARRLFVKVSKYLAALSAGSMIVVFVAITGMSPSMSRAGLVASLSLLAWYYGRKFHPLILLTLVAAITLLVNPSYGWGDLGWLLSFAAFFGVLVLAPLLQRYFFGEKKPGFVRQVLVETIAAQICTLPIILVVFGAFSIVAVLANLLILPLVPLAMLLTFLAGSISLAIPSMSSLAGAPAELLLSYMIWTAECMAGLPWAQRDVSISALVAIGLYGIIVAMCIYMQRVTRLQLRQVNVVE